MKYLLFCLIVCAFFSCKKYETLENNPDYLRLIGIWENVIGDDKVIVEFKKNGKIITKKSLNRDVVTIPYKLTVSKSIIYSTKGVFWDYYTFFPNKKTGAKNIANNLDINPTNDSMYYVTQFITNDTLKSNYILLIKQ